MGDQLDSCSKNFLLSRKKIASGPQINIHILKTKTRKTFAASPGQTADEELEAQPGETVRLLLSCENRITICHSFKRASFQYFVVNSLNKESIFPLYFQESDRFMIKCFFIVEYKYQLEEYSLCILGI